MMAWLPIKAVLLLRKTSVGWKCRSMLLKQARHCPLTVCFRLRYALWTLRSLHLWRRSPERSVVQGLGCRRSFAINVVHHFAAACVVRYWFRKAVRLMWWSRMCDHTGSWKYLNEPLPHRLRARNSSLPRSFWSVSDQLHSDMSSDSDSSASGNSDTDSVDSRDALSQPNLGAALRTRTLQPITPEEAWNHGDRYQQFAASGYTYADQANFAYRRSGSETSSIAGSVMSRGTGSNYAPSLTSSASTVQSRYSISTGRAPSSIYTRNVLVENDNGILERPVVRGALICEFHYLGCESTFDNLQEWDIHSRTHFHGASLPKTVDCPFECEWSVSRETGEAAWRERQAHIGGTHRFGGQRIDPSRTAAGSLIQHLWRERKIDPEQVQQLRMTGRLDRNRIYVQNNGIISDGRRQRRSRH
nr:hypothetical protein CFP56_00206 [Quercus suber]